MKWSLVTWLLALSCHGDATKSGTVHSFADEGKICLFPEGADTGNAFMPRTDPVAFPADRPARISVLAPTCLSSSCSHDIQATCTATLQGNVLTVSSTASFREEGQTCTADCGALVATCATPVLPAGTYQVRHGTETIMLTVPSTVAPPCAGQAP